MVMTGVEVDMVVTDSRAAFSLYERVFGAECIEVTSYDQGMNEAVFTMFGGRFHLLDENATYSLVAPKSGDNRSMWVNIVVPDIKVTHSAAIKAGFAEIQSVTELPDLGVINSVIADPFGYVWMLHEITCDVNFTERCAHMETQLDSAPSPV